jgi:hypothetical protein
MTGKAIEWPDDVDEILCGDLVVGVGTLTAKGGVALASVATLGIRDREAGTVGFTTSMGFGRKLERIARDPRLAIAYHTRQHGGSQRPGYVLVQGRATVRMVARREVMDRAAACLGQVADGRFWDWWLKTYYDDRVLVSVQVERILWWPDNESTAVVLGRPLPAVEAASQVADGDPWQPRAALRWADRASRRGHLLLGTVEADGMPLILPVDIVQRIGGCLGLRPTRGAIPSGSRRAGLLGHDFHPRLIGLWTSTGTGWLEARDGNGTWSPHTSHFFYAPPVKSLLLLGNGAAARWGYRQAVRSGRETALEAALQLPPAAVRLSGEEATRQ